MQALCKTYPSGIKALTAAVDGAGVAIAVARPGADVQTLRLAHPVVRTTSAVEVTAVAALMLSAVGLWLLVIPLELLGFVV